jgi:hypothetical protein
MDDVVIVQVDDGGEDISKESQMRRISTTSGELEGLNTPERVCSPLKRGRREDKGDDKPDDLLSVPLRVLASCCQSTNRRRIESVEKMDAKSALRDTEPKRY